MADDTGTEGKCSPDADDYTRTLIINYIVKKYFKFTSCMQQANKKKKIIFW